MSTFVLNTGNLSKMLSNCEQISSDNVG